MRRRTLLRALPAGAAALGGCLSRFPADDPPGSPSPNPITGSPTGTPPGDLPPCPDLGNGEAKTVCVGATPDAPSASLLKFTLTDATLPSAEASFTLTNTTDGQLSSNFYAWRLFQYFQDSWVHVTPRPVPEPLMLLQSGASHTWTLAVENGPLGTDEEAVLGGGTTDLALGGLPPGHYAFAISVSVRPDETPTATGSEGTATRTDASTATSTPKQVDSPIDALPEHVVLVARFRLSGESPGLVPAPDAEVASREDGVVEVTTAAGRDPDTPDVVVTAERAPEKADAAKPIPLALAYQSPGVRNTVPFFESGVDRVELTTGNYYGPLQFADDGTRLVTLLGETYRLSRTDE